MLVKDGTRGGNCLELELAELGGREDCGSN